MKKLCEFDNVEFEAKRSTARFCSTNCRVKAAQAAGVDANGEYISGAAVIDNEAVLTTIPVQDISLSPEREIYKAKADKLGITLTEYEKRLNAFVKMGVAKVDWISTGIPDFDALTMIPRGRVTQIQGRYGVGKTTLCLNMIAGQKGVRTLYIDTEAALTPDILMELGIDPKFFTLYNESAFIEDVAQVIENGAASGKFDLIVLDSVPMTITKTIGDSDISSRDIGAKAFILNKLIARIAMPLKETNTAMVFVNQVRDKIGGYFPETYTPGGSGITYQASLIIQLKTVKSWRFPEKPKDKVYLGHEVEVELVKSKVNTPHRKGKFKLVYPNPVAMENELELADFKPMETLSAKAEV